MSETLCIQELASDREVMSYVVESLKGDADQTLQRIAQDREYARQVANQLYWALREARSRVRYQGVMDALHKYISDARRHDEVRVSGFGEAIQLLAGQMLMVRQNRPALLRV